MRGIAGGIQSAETTFSERRRYKIFSRRNVASRRSLICPGRANILSWGDFRRHVFSDGSRSSTKNHRRRKYLLAIVTLLLRTTQRNTPCAPFILRFRQSFEINRSRTVKLSRIFASLLKIPPASDVI